MDDYLAIYGFWLQFFAGRCHARVELYSNTRKQSSGLMLRRRKNRRHITGSDDICHDLAQHIRLHFTNADRMQENNIRNAIQLQCIFIQRCLVISGENGDGFSRNFCDFLCGSDELGCLRIQTVLGDLCINNNLRHPAHFLPKVSVSLRRFPSEYL